MPSATFQLQQLHIKVLLDGFLHHMEAIRSRKMISTETRTQWVFRTTHGLLDSSPCQWTLANQFLNPLWSTISRHSFLRQSLYFTPFTLPVKPLFDYTPITLRLIWYYLQLLPYILFQLNSHLQHTFSLRLLFSTQDLHLLFDTRMTSTCNNVDHLTILFRRHIRILGKNAETQQISETNIDRKEGPSAFCFTLHWGFCLYVLTFGGWIFSLG